MDGMMNKTECKEQLQQDIVSYLDGMDDEILSNVCDIVISNINQIEEPNEVVRQTELDEKLSQLILSINRGTEALNLIAQIIRSK